MAAAPDPEEILRSTRGKGNFQRITRLLICGGTSLLREIFDLKCPPSNLPTILSNPVTEKKLKAAKLTMPQWRCLFPSPGVHGKSADFDVTLLVRLLRTICSLTPPTTGWDALPLRADQSLTADIARIKCYRNSVYGHVNQGMAIRDNEFKTLWQEISEALVRIAGRISSTRKTAWQGAIAKYLTDPLTTGDERNVQELKAWYENDMEIKKSIDEASERISRLEKAVHEGTDLMEATVCQETKEIKDHLKEMNQSIDALASSSAVKQLSRALLRLKIDCEAISGPGLQQGATMMIGQPQESQGVIKEGTVASVTSSQSQVSNTTASLGGNVGNGVTPSPQQVLSLIASKYLNNLNPSTPEEFNGFIRYMKEVRQVILVDYNPGSLIITVECGSLKILEGLWKDYCTGKLGRVVQECLVTEDILKELGLSEIKLITTIDEKDYKDCQKYLAGCSRESRSQPEELMRGKLSSIATSAESQSGRAVASTTEGWDDIGEPARKQRKLDTTETSKGKGSSPSVEKWAQPIIRSPRKQQKASDGEFVSEIFFALDYSSSVSEEEFQKEIEFVRRMSNSWNPENDLEAVVVYGNAAETVCLDPDSGTFSVDLQGLKTKAWRQSKGRRIDLALREAADRFTSSTNENLVVLLTAGRQLCGAESKEDDRELLVSATEAMSSKNIKVILVPVGMETDFRELGLIARRPQYLFPLDSFDHMTPQKASDIGSYIMETVDLESYAKNKVDQFSVIPKELSLWEITSLCSDVLEGAWYELYDNDKKSNKPNKIKMLIRESIDNFQSQLVTECRVIITLAVSGPLGAGKSFFLNSLLNLGLPDNFKFQSGPLPSADDDSQTPLPIYVKYGRKVEVIFQKQEAVPNRVIWFPEEEMRKDTLARVNSTLLTKFQERENFTVASYVVLQGPFPVFTDLKTRKMTTQGLHLELDVDVQFVDVPGFGDKTGNEAISGTLSKADIVLLFEGGQSGRHVSQEDIAQVFRRRDGQFEFVSRPKLVHIFNDRKNPSPPRLQEFDSLCKAKEKQLGDAWSCFRESIRKGDGIYKEAREKLPLLNSEDLLEKLSKESECIYFHSERKNFLSSLTNVVSDHVRNVKIKQTIHPFLQNVLWAAKMLKKRVVDSLYTTKKKKKLAEVNIDEVLFEMLSGLYEVEESELITSFVNKASFSLESGTESVHEFLYSNFLLSLETRHFLTKLLEKSLKSYTVRLTAAFYNKYLPVLEYIPGDIFQLTEMVCITRVKQFCANFAPAYLLDFLNRKKDQISLPDDVMSEWPSASVEEKSGLVEKYLRQLLNRAEMALEDNRTREKHASRTSHFHLMKTLKELVGKLLSASSFQDAYRTGCLESLKAKLPKVIEFCTDTIREINPHPKLDVSRVPSLPVKMENAKEEASLPSESSSHEKIIRDLTTKLLRNPDEKEAKDIIKGMKTMLKFKKHGHLELPPAQEANQRLWALALVNVLSDKEHFDIQLPPGIVLDPYDPRNGSLLKLARERLFAHQKSSVTCKIVKVDDRHPKDEIHLRINAPEKCLEAMVSLCMYNRLNAICEEFRDPTNQLAPIFIPIIRPGQTLDIQGNYFLEEDPWCNASLIHDDEKDGKTKKDSIQDSSLGLNIFLVVEPNHVERLKSTINGLRKPTENDVRLIYVVLPQKGRGIGVTRSIIKSLAECFTFSLYWTIDDNIQFMYWFVEDDRRWHKCPLISGLLFGQRVFQSCLEKSVKQLSDKERDELFIRTVEGWENWAKYSDAGRNVRKILYSEESFSEVQKNPNLLNVPFINISEICGGDPVKEVTLKAYKREFVDTCRKWLFEDTINHISGVSLAHVTSKGSDLMSRYPNADYMRSEQLSQVVLNNGFALKGKNFVSDEVILFDGESQIFDEEKCSDPYWGIKGSEESFRRALLVSGVAGYRVIRIVYKDKKLRNAFDRPGSNFTSQWLDRSQDDDMDEDVYMGD